ncbi:hypothetical protein FRC12_002105 [Ceratobasidium sp. 428]|nr:hypothetical protein FRC12_002105 [Ceratobasidium sp. 428]
MPKLERLALYIILEDPGNPELSQPNNSLRILASGFDWNLYLHGKNERDEIVENTVRFLSALCPNVRILFEPRPKQSSYQPKESAAIREVIGSINRRLALLAPSSRSLLYQSVLHPETAWPQLYS